MRRALDAHHKGETPSIELIEKKLGPVSDLAKGIDAAANAPRRDRRRH
jgi:hypothetical protein